MQSLTFQWAAAAPPRGRSRGRDHAVGSWGNLDRIYHPAEAAVRTVREAATAAVEVSLYVFNCSVTSHEPPRPKCQSIHCCWSTIASSSLQDTWNMGTCTCTVRISFLRHINVDEIKSTLYHLASFDLETN